MKIIKLTESDLNRLVKKVIKEEEQKVSNKLKQVDSEKKLNKNARI